jgi:hypothetical protein
MDTITCSCGAKLNYCASGVIGPTGIMPDPKKAAFKLAHRPHLIGKFHVAYSVDIPDDEPAGDGCTVSLSNIQ